MLNIDKNIENDLDAIIYYYTMKEKIDKYLSLIVEYYDKITKIHKQVEKFKKNLNNELSGYYKDMIDFVKKDDSYETVVVNKKVKEGILEHLTDFIHEKDEVTAVNKYLKTKGIKIHCNEAINIDELLGLSKEKNSNESCC